MPESVPDAIDPNAPRRRTARSLLGIARHATALVAGTALLLALVPTVIAGVAPAPTVSFPVPSPVVIGGPEVSWNARLTNPADGVDIPNTQVRLIIDPNGHATAADLTLSLLPDGQTDRLTLPLTDQPDGTITLALNGSEGFDLPPGTSTGARFYLRAGAGAHPGAISVTIVVAAGDGSGGLTDLTSDGRTVKLVKASGPSIGLDRAAVEPGGRLKVSVDGFKPGSTVAVELHSSVVPLGTIKIGTGGSGSLTVTVPTSANGAHEVVARGRSVTGKAVAVSAAVQVGLPDSATDGASATRGREPADTNDTGRWLLLLGGSLVTIVALRRRLVETPTPRR